MRSMGIVLDWFQTYAHKHVYHAYDHWIYRDITLTQRARSNVNWVELHSIIARFMSHVQFSKFSIFSKYSLQALIVGSKEKSSSSHRDSLLICANLYETDTSCVSYAIWCWCVSSTHWCIFEVLCTVVSKHVGSQHPGSQNKWSYLDKHLSESRRRSMTTSLVTAYQDSVMAPYCRAVRHSACASTVLSL